MDSVASRVYQCSSYSDQCEDSLKRLGTEFLAAHERCNGKATLEIGTRCGGSALLMLDLLRDVYSYPLPMLYTVDPYGNMPYRSGGHEAPLAVDMTAQVFQFGPLYGYPQYRLMKMLLAPYSNHVHYHMTSDVFFANMLDVPYWSLGEEKTIRGEGIAFAFIDGAHDCDNIVRDVASASKLIHPRGAIVVDNIDKDPATTDNLLALAKSSGVTASIFGARDGERQMLLRYL